MHKAVVVVLFASAGLLAAPVQARNCKGDAVKVGSICVDKYEASAWEIASSNSGLIKRVQKGKIQAVADMGGAAQRGTASDDYGPTCPDTGAPCTDLYAVSIPNATPARFITWFQAAAACANAGKRLLTNQEWTVAALGTPDPGTDNGTTDCNIITSGSIASTGSRTLCVSTRGVVDMVGNADEWVADWVPSSTSCPGWGGFSTDTMCLAGADTTAGPGALIRGGDFQANLAGVLSIQAQAGPFSSDVYVGFRCAREP